MNYSQNNPPLVQKYYSTWCIKYSNIGKKSIYIKRRAFIKRTSGTPSPLFLSQMMAKHQQKCSNEGIKAPFCHLFLIRKRIISFHQTQNFCSFGNSAPWIDYYPCKPSKPMSLPSEKENSDSWSKVTFNREKRQHRWAKRLYQPHCRFQMLLRQTGCKYVTKTEL